MSLFHKTKVPFPYKKGQHGAYPDRPDFRDLPVGAVLPAAQVLPKEYDVVDDLLGGDIDIEDQNGSSSCVGQTFTKYKEILDSIELGHKVNLSQKNLYAHIKISQGGAYLRDAADRLFKVGVPEDILDPSYPATEEALSVKNDSPEILTNAAKYKVKAYASVDNTIDLLRASIFNFHGVAIGSNVSGSGWGYDAVKNSGGFVAPPKSGEDYGGHAFLFRGYSDIKQAFKLQNSWSKNWGLNGCAWFRYSDLAWLYSGWTLVDAPSKLIDALRDMYNLRKSPSKPTEIYAISGKVVRHIANWQTLTLGNKEPDRYWIVPNNGAEGIPVATPEEWNGVVEADEIHIDPHD